MIRSSAALVVVAIGMLIGGMAAGSLLLVYLAIGASVVALAVLAVAVAVKRDELFAGDARSASSGAQERAEQPIGQQASLLQETPQRGGREQQGALEQQAASGWHGASGWQGQGHGAIGWQDAQSGPAQAPVTAGAGAPWSAFSREGSPQAPSARPGAWPPPEAGFPAAPAATAGTPDAPVGFRRPAAPPTRADPVLPWADAMPTRVDIVKGSQAEPVPTWLEDVDEPASPPAGRTPLASQPRVEPQAPARPQAPTPYRWPADLDAPADLAGAGDDDDAGNAVGRAEVVAIADEPGAQEPVADARSARTVWSKITWAADAGTGDSDASTDDATGAVAADADADAATDDADYADAATDDADDADAATDDADAVTSASPESADADTRGEGTAEVLDAEQPAAAGPVEGTGPSDGAGLVESTDSTEASGPREPGGPVEATDTVKPDAGTPSTAMEQVTVVPGVPRYHEADCILIRFMDDEDLQRMAVADATAAGCTPCRACRPE